MVVLFTACSSGETSYSLNDLQTIIQDSNLTVDKNVTIDKMTNTTPSVFPILYSPIMTAKVDTPIEGDSYVYSISGEDSPFFNINQNGTLYFIKLPYYDQKEDKDHNNIFKVIIKVTDQHSTATIQISVTIAKDAEHVLPVIQTSHITLFENNSTSIPLQAYSGTSSALSYTLEPGYDETLFSIDEHSGLLMFNSTPDFENPQDSDADNNFTLVIRVTDQTAYANTTTKTVHLSVLNLSTPTALKFYSLVETNGEGLDHYFIIDDTHLSAWWKKDYTRTYSVQLDVKPLEKPIPLTYTKVSGDSIFSLSIDGLLTINLPRNFGNQYLPIVINVCNYGECQEMTLHLETH